MTKHRKSNRPERRAERRSIADRFRARMDEDQSLQQAKPAPAPRRFPPLPRLIGDGERVQLTTILNDIAARPEMLTDNDLAALALIRNRINRRRCRECQQPVAGPHAVGCGLIDPSTSYGILVSMAHVEPRNARR